LIEIRFHGRGGQGAVTASRILATAAFLEGKHSQSIPMYGTERRGAPVTAFVRIGEKDKMVRSLVHEPDYVVVLDPLLRKSVNVTDGLKQSGMLVINSTSTPDKIEVDKRVTTATVDATGIALEIIRRPITNTAILGAFCKATGEVKLESVLEAVKDNWTGRLAEMNANAVKAAYDRTLVGEPKLVEKLQRVAAPTRSKADWRTFQPVVDIEKCIGCKQCWMLCPDGSIDMVDKKCVINYDFCKGCGICAEECPVNAIEMKMEVE
jgi:2-oxoacid:acceptor oxidoreductase gamma subunit (pyruvate/2-ketoisovalerate family)/2-oxoacid:acceptor oxidoreductase delta subunit (pyruvate/2-ketoisovalerate family)